MRVLSRLLVVLVLLLGLGVAALAFFLPRLVESDAMRERIGQAARDATGREVSWSALELGVLPPRVTVSEARMAGVSEQAEPLLEGATVELRLALLPLLARAVVVDSLQVEGATLRLVRSAEGIELPEPPAKPAAAAAAPRETVADAEADEGFALAVRQVTLRDVRVVLEDRAVEPAVTWDLRDIQASLRGRSLDDPLDLELSGVLASGGSLELSGSATPAGPFDLDLRLDGVQIDSAAPYLEAEQRATGRVSGSIAARGEAPDPQQVTLDLDFENADLALGEVAARGKLRLRADLSGGLERPSGSFQLDATDASLRYGQSFQKEPGTPATAEGRVVTDPDGSIGIDDTRVRIQKIDAKVSARSGARTRLTVDAEPFELEGLEALLPDLAESPPAGRLGFAGLALATAPAEARGRILLDGVRLRQEGAADLELRGALVGEGGSLRGDGLVAMAGSQEVPIELEIADPLGKMRIHARSQLEDADTAVLLEALAGQEEALSGPLDLDLDLRASLSGDGPLAASLSGPVRFEIRPGRLKGVSLFQGLVERLGQAGEAAVVLGRVKGGSSLQRFYDDEFARLGATFQLGGGKARTDDLRIVYRNYSVDLRGSVGLADMSLDMSGTLSIDEEIDAVLSGEEASVQEPASIADDAPPPRRAKIFPLTRVYGTLDAPKVDLSRQAIVSLAAQYTLASKREKVEKYEGKIDEVLGEGTGKQVFDAIEGLFGGGKRP